MRLLAGVTAGLAVGVTIMIVTRRYLPSALWWLFGNGR